MTEPLALRATVVAANVNRDARAAGEKDRYDLVLDLLDGDGSLARHELVGVQLGSITPMVGSAVAVEVHDGVPAVRWRGDPNLDVEAHRRQLAELAKAAQQRRPPR